MTSILIRRKNRLMLEMLQMMQNRRMSKIQREVNIRMWRIKRKKSQKQTKKDGSSRQTTGKGGKSKTDKDSKTGPIDKFVKAAKNFKEVLETPKGKQRSAKTRTPPSLTKDKDVKNIDLALFDPPSAP